MVNKNNSSLFYPGKPNARCSYSCNLIDFPFASYVWGTFTSTISSNYNKKKANLASSLNIKYVY